MHDARDVEEVPVVEIVRDAVAAPGAAAHRQRERQRVVEAAAGREAVRLVDDHAADRQRESQLERAVRRPRMKADRVPGALVAQQPLGERRGGGEVVGAIERQHRRQLLAGERMLGTDAVLARRSGTSPRAAPGGRAPRARRSSPAACAMNAGASLPPANIAASSCRASAASSSTPPSRANAATQRVVHGRDGDHAVLRRARRRVIERLRPRDLRGGGGNVGRLVDDHRHVAGADADRRRAAFVGGAHVVLRPGRDDEIRLPHQRVASARATSAPPAAARGRAARRRGRARRARIPAAARAWTPPSATARG